MRHSGQRGAVDQRQRLAGVARHQQIAAVDRRLAASWRCPGNTLTSLQPIKRSPELRPGRHQQQLGLAARRLRDHVRCAADGTSMSARNASVERVDQRVVGEDAVDVVGGDDAHAALPSGRRGGTTKRAATSHRAPAALGGGVRCASSRARRSRAVGLGAARPRPPLVLPQPGGDAADQHAEADQHEDQDEQRQLAARTPDARSRTDRTRR